MVSVGLIGVGGMGSTHFKILKDLGIKVTAISDVDESRLAEYSKMGIKTFKDYTKMLDEGGFDGVIIATPPNLHAEQAVYALRRGYYVFLEKPMASDLEGARRIYDEARGKGRLMIGFTLRFHKLYIMVKDLLDSRLGKPVVMWHIALGTMPKTGWLRDKGVSGGILNEHGVHVLYQYYWYAGRVREVYADAVTITSGITVEDNVTVFMKHENGATSIFHLSWSGGHNWRRWGLTAERGRVTVDGYVDGDYVVSDLNGNVIEKGNFSEPIMHAYVDEVRHFINCIENNERPIINEEDGYHVQQIVDAAYRSALTRSKVTI
jgi:predicted dehydrogenase